MKKLLFTFQILLISFSISAQSGKITESLKVTSKILGKEVKYSIYLPEGYENSNRRFPVLYLLHGYTDDETGWVQFGDAGTITDKAINSGEVPSMIIVMPDAGVTWYVNDYQGKTKFEDFFMQELIPFIDATYRTRTAKEFRAVAGLSMGGYGSLIYAIKYPDKFTACVPMSAAVRTDEEWITGDEKRWNEVWGDLFGKNLNGKERLTPHYYKNSVLKLIETAKPEDLKKVAFYIDCGDKDFLIKGNMAVHAALIDKKIPHEFRVREGNHNWLYWRTLLPTALKFVGERFHR